MFLNRNKEIATMFLDNYLALKQKHVGRVCSKRNSYGNVFWFGHVSFASAVFIYCRYFPAGLQYRQVDVTFAGLERIKKPIQSPVLKGDSLMVGRRIQLSKIGSGTLSVNFRTLMLFEHLQTCTRTHTNSSLANSPLLLPLLVSSPPSSSLRGAAKRSPEQLNNQHGFQLAEYSTFF